MNILIVGAGYVGSACARHLLKRQYEVLCLVRSSQSAERLGREGFNVMASDVADAASWVKTGFQPDAVLYCPSTGGGGPEEYRHIHITGLQQAIAHLPSNARLFYTSSTSVYGQSDGALVDEQSETSPVTESGRILLEAEKMTVQAGGTVLRLAGIYGPGRTVLLGKFLDGSAVLPPDPDHVLNLIHRDDIVAAFQTLLDAGTPGIYNVTDNEPSSYREIYGWLAEKLNRPMPPSADGDFLRRRGITNKRVSNRKLRSLGWEPAFPSFREGYTALI